jgi:hypothetical protein
LGSPDWPAVVDVAIVVAILGFVDTIMVNFNNIKERVTKRSFTTKNKVF